MTLLLCCELLEVRVQAIEALLPDVPVVLRPLRYLLERRRLDPARPALRVAPLHDQPRALQHAQVLGHGGQAHAEGLRELADRAFAAGEASQDGPAGGIRQ